MIYASKPNLNGGKSGHMASLANLSLVEKNSFITRRISIADCDASYQHGFYEKLRKLFKEKPELILTNFR